MSRTSGNKKSYLVLILLSLFFVVQGLSSVATEAQTFTATRIDGRPSTPEFDPIIDESTFAAVNTDSSSNSLSDGGNINGPSIIRVPDWIPISERVHPSAKYYLYFGNHRGDDIRMAWSDSLTGTWTLFNVSGGSGPLNNDRAWGVNGNNTGTQTPLHGVLTMVGNRIISLTNSDFLVSDHVASPEVIVDNVNQRLVMNIHGTTQFLAQPGQGTGQRSFVTTSKYGLDFNPDNGLRATPSTLTTSAAVIATWDNWNDTSGNLNADDTAAGFSAFFSGDAFRDIRTEPGAVDGTFGTLGAPMASTTDRTFRMERTGLFGMGTVAENLAITRTLTATITNNSGAATELSGVFFDMMATNQSYNSWTVLHNGVELASGGPINEDIWVNSDGAFNEPIAFANGQTVELDIVFSGATLGFSSSRLDNFAITVGPVTTTGGEGSEPELHGLRDVVTARAYVRSFQVGGRTFAYTNGGDLWRAPAFNDAGEVNTIANADSEGGLWNPSGVNTTAAWWEMIPTSENPLLQFYQDNGQSTGDPRHSGTYTRTHIDPNDTNVYLFYTARNDTPEMIFLTVIDTNNGSTEPSQWTTIGQRIILRAELDWEGGDLLPTTSENGAQTNVNQLRDPLIFEDDKGTEDPSDDKLYMFYTGEGEEAIGFAELTFEPNLSNITGEQGDLIDLLLGDINLDGFVNFFDISPFIELLSAQTFQAEADLNGSGVVNFFDISPFIKVLAQ